MIRVDEQQQQVGAYRIRVNGQARVVDPRTLTMIERRQIRIELANVAKVTGIECDQQDQMIAEIWAVLRRDEPGLLYDDVCAGVTLADVMAAAIVDDSEVGSSPEV